MLIFFEQAGFSESPGARRVESTIHVRGTRVGMNPAPTSANSIDHACHPRIVGEGFIPSCRGWAFSAAVTCPAVVADEVDEDTAAEHLAFVFSLAPGDAQQVLLVAIAHRDDQPAADCQLLA